MIKKIALFVLMAATCASLAGVCYGCYQYNKQENSITSCTKDEMKEQTRCDTNDKVKDKIMYSKNFKEITKQDNVKNALADKENENV